MGRISIGLVALLALGLAPLDGMAFNLPDSARHDTLAAESTTPLEVGTAQISVSHSHAEVMYQSRGLMDNSWRWRRAEDTRIWETNLEFAYGFHRDAQYSIGLTYAGISDKHLPFGERSGEGLDDLDMSVKWRFRRAPRRGGVNLAWLSTFSIPVGTSAEQGRLKPSKDFFALTNRLMASSDFRFLGGDFILNADAGYMLPMAGRRRHYSRDFGRAVDNTRGIFDANAALALQIWRLKPEVGVGYAREWVRGDGASELVSATAGATVSLTEKTRLKGGYRQTITARNGLRLGTIFGSLAIQF